MNISELKSKITVANQAYRLGKPVISDKEYDFLIEELEMLSPDDELLTKVGHTIADESRKCKLPIKMASMNKVKTIAEINDWVRLKEINRNQEVIITPKYDGLSLCVNEVDNQACTRGDGEFGQKSDAHYKLIQNHLYEDVVENDNISEFNYSYGEVMMPKKIFIDKYSAEFANPRNLVAGLINNKEATKPLADCQYIKYGGVTKAPFFPKTKQEIIDNLNENQRVKVNYHICKISDLTEEILLNLFAKWSNDYEIDGLIIEVNDLQLQ